MRQNSHSTPPVYLRFSNHAVNVSGGTCLSLNLCWSLDMLTGPQVSWQLHRLIDQLGEYITIYKLCPSLFTLWLILHMLPMFRTAYWLIIWGATTFCSTNLPKASSLSKITYIRSEGIDHWTVIQSGRVIKLELSYDGAARGWRSWPPIFFVTPCLSSEGVLFSLCLSSTHPDDFCSRCLFFLPYLSHLFLFIEIFVSARFLDITGS